ncbi:MAG: histidine kinase dimerization/phosphoacceptor domain -containing protein [Bacteroidota bacterium]
MENQHLSLDHSTYPTLSGLGNPWFAAAIISSVLLCASFIAIAYMWRKKNKLKQQLSTLGDQTKKLSTFTKASNNLVIVTGKDGNTLWVNEVFEKTSGYKVKDLNKYSNDLFIQGKLNDDALKKALDEATSHKQSYFQQKRTTRSGSIYWVNVSINPIYDQNQCITEILVVEEPTREMSLCEIHQFESTDAEKDVLISEIHHRIKNNLQTVLSMLSIEARGTSEQSSQGTVNAIQNRIRVITLVYRSLCKSENLGHINAQRYIQNLIMQLQPLCVETSQIGEVVAHIEQTHLRIDSAIPLGLIINEFIKRYHEKIALYAEPTSLNFELKTLSDSHELRFRVVCPDLNLISDEDEPTSPGLNSFEFISGLSNQLEGKVKYSNQTGTRFDLLFKEESLHQFVVSSKVV